MSSSHSRIDQIAYAVLFSLVLPAILAAWAIALDRNVTLPMVGSRAAGIVIAAVAALLIIAAVVALRVQGGGWPMSPFPPPRFVTSGVYALVAHPLYLGSTLLVLGVSMIFASPAGVWIVTPFLAAACIAWVWGFENERTASHFGARTSRPLIHLPAATADQPSIADRLSTVVLALVPWLIVYEAINLLPTPPDAIPVASRWDARIPVIGWTELVYFLAYPLVIFAPLVAREARELRTLILRAWVATAGSAIVYLTLPTVFPKKPVPDTVFAPMLEWERAFDAPNTALPAFHVIWPMLVLHLYTRRWRAPIVLAIAVSCVTTGMHAIIDVVVGLVLGLAFLHIEAVWRVLARGAEKLSGSWAEWRVGPLRLINHGIYVGAGVALTILLITALAGEPHRLAILFIAVVTIAGAAVWAQAIEGSSALQRPFGYYGGVLGSVSAIAVTSIWTRSGLLLLGAYCVGATFIQAFGRLRCLVQGCCHGRPTTNAVGIRVVHPKSRVVRIAGFAGVPLHPTALYSIVINLATGALLVRLWIAGAPLAFIAGAYFILAGLARFVEEHYRGEPQTRVVAGLRLYQWLSIASVVAGIGVSAIPSPLAPPVSALSMETALAALALGVIAYFAYGVDFPESNRRFARLA